MILLVERSDYRSDLSASSLLPEVAAWSASIDRGQHPQLLS